MGHGHGKIWPEYWIDCCKCDHSRPLATTKSPAREAIKQGFKRDGNTSVGPWMCPQCVARAAAPPQP